ncbi:hypothetical protein [Paenibacillus sp. FSL R7-0331]|uniref:hypothetical protein n=1 Tax=Paenibacillus sp. FSL R7-0331 TaxID=1536773 RepID=UPI0012E07ED1|nr:hypothetical protein [Paenibacillus sp. FSL R7-0331]
MNNSIASVSRYFIKNRKPVSECQISSMREYYSGIIMNFSSKDPLTALAPGYYNQNQEKFIGAKAATAALFHSNLANAYNGAFPSVRGGDGWCSAGSFSRLPGNLVFLFLQTFAH